MCKIFQKASSVSLNVFFIRQRKGLRCSQMFLLCCIKTQHLKWLLYCETSDPDEGCVSQRNVLHYRLCRRLNLF